LEDSFELVDEVFSHPARGRYNPNMKRKAIRKYSHFIKPPFRVYFYDITF
jgi:hypothetical protein